MNINSLKSGFKEYLQELNQISNKNYKTDSDYSIFEYSNEFLKYLSDEVQTDASVFSMNINDISNNDITNGEIDFDNQTGDSYESSSTEEDLAKLLNTMFELENVKSIIDADSNGELDDDEIMNFLNSIIGYDNNEKTLSLEDIISAMKDINDNNFKLKEESQTETQPQSTNNATSGTAGSSGAAGTSGGASGVSGSSSAGSAGSAGSSSGTGSSSSTSSVDDGETLEELESLRTEKQGELQEAQDAVSDVYSGENEAVKQAQEDSDKAQEEYDKAVEEDENISEELKQQKEENDKQIAEKENTINQKKADINTKENEISAKESELSSEQSNLAALQSALATYETTSEDSENQQEMAEKKAAVKQKIADSEKKIQDIKDAIQKLNDDKKTLEDDKKIAEDDLNGLKQDQTTIQGEIAKVCKPETKEAMQACNDAKNNLEQVKTTEETKAKEVVETKQSELDEINKKIDDKKAQETIKENSAQDKSVQALLDFALSKDGLSAEQMKKLMQEAGCQFDDGQWCADFVTYCLKQVYGDDIPGDFANTCSNTAYCPTIEEWAKSNGSYTTDSSQVEPGDLIIYTRKGQAGHIGIVTSVNADGTVNTIEGNTSNDSGGYGSGWVNEHHNVSDARSFVRLSALK